MFGCKVKQPAKEHMISFQAIQLNYCRGCGKWSVCITAVSPREDHCRWPVTSKTFSRLCLLVYQQKMFPYLQRKRDFNYSCEKSISSCNSTFQTFFIPHECETKTSWRFSPRESMLSLTLPDQVQYGVQAGLNKECKFKPFSNISWAPGCLGEELLHIYPIYKQSNILLQPGLDPSRVCELDCCDLGRLLVHLYLSPARGQDSCPKLS